MDIAIQYTTLLVVIVTSFFAGVLSLYGLMVYKIWKNDDADDSNVTNPVRVLNHLILHKFDFLKMVYLTDEQMAAIKKAFPDWLLKRPFWYWDKDEYSQVVKTRP